MNLFDRTPTGSNAPLAARMRPASLDEVVGQSHLVAPQSVFRRALEGDRLPSIIFHGPAGTGKSTLARIVANHTSRDFVELSAVSAGVREIRAVAEQARQRRSLNDVGTILFVDEIHRLNKAQQDQLLPHVEEGTFTLIGATTENPFFSVISPLLSRCRLFSLEKLTEEELQVLLRRALEDRERGLGGLNVELAADALEHLARGASGDARAALNALELGALSVRPDGDGKRVITIADAEEALQKPVLKYDRDGVEHYDTISAFIKSMRGSDPDAAVYWLAKMLEAGEDPRFIARRIIIQAAEDVGLADPTALRVAVAAADAVEYVGLPEAQIPLAMAAIHIAVSPKSNSAYKAISQARELVRKQGAEAVPPHLAGGPRPGDSRDEYLYPHDHPRGWVAQQYLPSQVEPVQFYHPGDNPREARIAAYLADLKGAAGTAPGESGEAADPSKGE